MSKKLFSLFFIIVSVSIIMTHSVSAFANGDDVVHKINIVRKDVPTRSISVLPEASVGNDVLAVSFDDSGMYMLCIEDSFGATVYTSTLPADGMEYSYDLTGIGEGMFTLILEGPSGEYEGIFNI